MINLFRKKNKEPEDIKDILECFKKLDKKVNSLSEELTNLKTEKKSFVQKLGITRFNPFADVGGNQSFSLALLDEEDNGVVITSLYEREKNRVYAKSIKNGKSEHVLSEEEQKAIKNATNK